MRRLVIVSGTRDRDALEPSVCARIALDLREIIEPGAVLIHGAALGVDTLARDAWLVYASKYQRCAEIAMPAQWDKYGPAAGPKRNQAIADMALAMHECGWDIYALCYPAPGSKGTQDMIERLMWRRGNHARTGNKVEPFHAMPTERWTVRVHELGVSNG